MKGYDTVEYARSRLIETIVMRDKEPVLIMSVEGTNDNIVLTYSSLLRPKGHLDVARMEEFDFNPVSLGYVNHGRSAYYLMRTPMRRDWKQGLRMINIVDAEGQSPRLIPYRSMAQTIMGSFPTFKSALNKINSDDDHSSIAFHKDFSVSREGPLRYKGIFSVGNVDMNNGNVLIQENWVREAFEEAMEKAA